MVVGRRWPRAAALVHVPSSRLGDGVIDEEDTVDRLLRRLGRGCAGRPWRVVSVWVVAVVAATAMSLFAGGTYRDDMTAPGTSSAAATAQLREHLPEAAHARAHVVARWDGTADADALREASEQLDALPFVDDVREQRSPDRRTVLLAVTYDRELPDLDAPTATEQLTAVAAVLAGSGAAVGVGGQVPEAVQGPNGVAESIGVAAAAVVLLVAFGSLVAASLPLAVAAAGLGVGLALVSLLAAVTDVSSVSPTLGSMIGLGVGIDYALFVVTRQRQCLRAGLSAVEAAGVSVATAGRSVLFAAACVLVGLTGLAWSGVPGFAWMGVAAGIVAAVTAAAAVTLLPALLGLAGARVMGRNAPRARATGEAGAGRVAAAVVRRPRLAAVAAVAVLLALAAPALSMRLGQNDAGSEPASSSTRQAYDLVNDDFGPGANGPLLVVADTAAVTPEELAALGTTLAAQPGVARVLPAGASPDGDLALLTVVPVTGPQHEDTADLVRTLHERVLPTGAELTGPTAALLDTTDVLRQNLWKVVLAVLAATAVLLVPVFRSLVLPVKAVLMNLLSIGASFGMLTLAFQTQVGAQLIGLSQPVPIAAWAPMVLFAIVFGLSMDYEVFLLGAVREEHERGTSPADSIIHGLGTTTRTITSAAAIMVAVATGFALDPGVMVKIIGVGLATAIVIDVTLVRLVLVPATMTLMGRANWWVPSWLARLLPVPATSQVAPPQPSPLPS